MADEPTLTTFLPIITRKVDKAHCASKIHLNLLESYQDQGHYQGAIEDVTGQDGREKETTKG
jgi:hypothetical protein